MYLLSQGNLVRGIDTEEDVQVFHFLLSYLGSSHGIVLFLHTFTRPKFVAILRNGRRCFIRPRSLFTNVIQKDYKSPHLQTVISWLFQKHVVPLTSQLIYNSHNFHFPTVVESFLILVKNKIIYHITNQLIISFLIIYGTPYYTVIRKIIKPMVLKSILF